LHKLTPDRLFEQKTWKELTAFVQIIPDGDILPSRGQYNPETKDWQVAIKHLYAKSDDAKQALWFSLPDIAASVLLTKRVPEIVNGFRLKVAGQLEGLTPTKLRGMIDVDPAREDSFRVVIEQRMALPMRTDLSDLERRRLIGESGDPAELVLDCVQQIVGIIRLGRRLLLRHPLGKGVAGRQALLIKDDFSCVAIGSITSTWEISGANPSLQVAQFRKSATL
jgi:hypothetical protein